MSPAAANAADVVRPGEVAEPVESAEPTLATVLEFRSRSRRDHPAGRRRQA